MASRHGAPTRLVLARPAAQALLIALVGTGLVGGGCGEAPLPQRQLRTDDCLRGLQLNRLEAQLQRCNQVVAAFPSQPGPRNDRYLLRSLAGDDVGACNDIATAIPLAAKLPTNPENDQLRSELKLRQSICQAPERAVAAPTPTSAPSAPAP